MCPPHRPPPLPAPHPVPPGARTLPHDARTQPPFPLLRRRPRWPTLVLSLSALLLPHKAEGAPAPAPLVAALRAGIVLTTAACAALFTDSFALFTSLVGSLAISLQTTILPPLFYARICGPRAGPLRTSLAVGMACAGALVAAASVAAVVGDLARGQGASPEGAARL
eukprot:tig00020629_g12383.t1